MQNLEVASHVGQVVAHHRDFSAQKICARNFGHKDQAVFHHRDRKSSFHCNIGRRQYRCNPAIYTYKNL